jgi:hypothetical protein
MLLSDKGKGIKIKLVPTVEEGKNILLSTGGTNENMST